MRRAAILAAILALLLLCGCASGAPSAHLALPSTDHPAALASATLYTSPDGGIYQNPDRLQLDLVSQEPLAPLARLLPRSAASWQPLAALGRFTLIGLTLRNDGKGGSDAQMNATQIASDYAPAATSSGPLRHWYHPLFPLAMLSVAHSDASCTLHADPGQSVTAVLIYPPLRPAASIVWGVYGAFALRVPFGGALPAGTGGWTATACVPPQQTAPSS